MGKDEKVFVAEMKRLKEELAVWQKVKTPRCLNCKKAFINGIDPLTGKFSKHIWKPDCECYSGRNLILCMG